MTINADWLCQRVWSLGRVHWSSAINAVCRRIASTNFRVENKHPLLTTPVEWRVSQLNRSLKSTKNFFNSTIGCGRQPSIHNRVRIESKAARENCQKCKQTLC